MDIWLQRLLTEITATTAQMSPEDLTRHAAQKWSAGEILEHLLLSYTGTIKGLERCRLGSKTTRVPSWKDRFGSALVLGAGYLPTGRIAPKQTTPRGADPAEVIGSIPLKIEEMDRLLSECEEHYGKSARILDHPVLGPFTAQQWRKFHWVHGKHHLKQIVKLRS